MAMPKTWIRPMDSWTMDRSKNGSWIGKNPENNKKKIFFWKKAWIFSKNGFL